MEDSDLFVLYCVNERAQQTGLPACELARALLQIPPEQIKAAADADRAYRKEIAGGMK
ncbi:hypothetical protein [Microbulbifer spongiae]|uniref:Uncharacterized protein n=1 Tax=Microbulbifer spongiae TaxID=2944933 RepID=A0ABY9EHB8_9GAMM|nr:hypothetical protein [Microbulbifer sp. MI-G]WKD51712.1 hypothetical protein M8T91_18545 [Microbulbifer sp. MI-G]